ncbi:MAG: PASTA domain-containing protein, partial [Planctomycetota bacterium]
MKRPILTTRTRTAVRLLVFCALVVFSLPANAHASDVNVPDVVGMTEADANSTITDANLTVGNVTYDYNDTIPYEIVISQNPTADTQVPIGSSVDLVVSLGQPTIPDVVGMTEPNATTEITSVDNL